MAHLGRLLFVIIFFVGLGIGWRRLADFDVPFADVLAPALWVIGGIVALLVVIPAVGRLLGRFARDD